MVYGVCKGGVIVFSKVLAWELGRYNVIVNVVCFGLMFLEKFEDVGIMSFWYFDSL